MYNQGNLLVHCFFCRSFIIYAICSPFFNGNIFHSKLCFPQLQNWVIHLMYADGKQKGQTNCRARYHAKEKYKPFLTKYLRFICKYTFYNLMGSSGLAKKRKYLSCVDIAIVQGKNAFFLSSCIFILPIQQYFWPGKKGKKPYIKVWTNKTLKSWEVHIQL